MKKIVRNITILILPVLLIAIACKKKQDVAPVENVVETITILRLYFTDRLNSSSVSVYSFRDPDASGALPYATLDTIKLSPNKIYDTKIILLNQMRIPEDSISYEIYKEKEQHQLFYEVSGDAVGKLKVTYATTDVDSNSVPLGLKPVFTTTSASTLKTGKVKIILKHQPGLKPTSGQGDSTKGKTDIQVNFPVLIQ